MQEVSMNPGDVQLQVKIPPEIVQYWGWFLAFWIGALTLGIAAVGRSAACFRLLVRSHSRYRDGAGRWQTAS
jgi:hypothetical protein